MQKQQLTPDEWRSKLCESRDKWARLGEDERQSYIAKAAEEEGLRREACKQPFASRGSHSSIPNCPEDGTSPAAFDAASHLGRNSLKKIPDTEFWPHTEGSGRLRSGLCTIVGLPAMMVHCIWILLTRRLVTRRSNRNGRTL